MGGFSSRRMHGQTSGRMDGCIVHISTAVDRWLLSEDARKKIDLVCLWGAPAVSAPLDQSSFSSFLCGGVSSGRSADALNCSLNCSPHPQWCVAYYDALVQSGGEPDRTEPKTEHRLQKAITFFSSSSSSPLPPKQTATKMRT